MVSNQVLSKFYGTLALEGFIELRSYQDPSDRRKYLDAAMESTLNAASRAKLVQQLYTDILSKKNIDFGEIPKSKGDITKYVNYKEMLASIEALKSLFGDKPPVEMKYLEALHNNVITHKADFVFGFNTYNELIILNYNLLVSTILELINYNIVTYANYLKEVRNVDFDFSKGKVTSPLIKYAENYVKAFSNGDWDKMMVNLKKDGSNLLGEVTDIVLDNPILLGIIAVIGVLLITRNLIYFFYNRAAKFSDYLQNQRAFLEYNMNRESAGYDKQKDLSDKLLAVSNFIEAKILKTQNAAAKDISESSSKNYNVGELRSIQGDTGYVIG